jgi:hypothetical protein
MKQDMRVKLPIPAPTPALPRAERPGGGGSSSLEGVLMEAILMEAAVKAGADITVAKARYR